jgi:hypothetical protein
MDSSLGHCDIRFPLKVVVIGNGRLPRLSSAVLTLPHPRLPASLCTFV